MATLLLCCSGFYYAQFRTRIAIELELKDVLGWLKSTIVIAEEDKWTPYSRRATWLSYRCYISLASSIVMNVKVYFTLSVLMRSL